MVILVGGHGGGGVVWLDLEWSADRSSYLPVEQISSGVPVHGR